MKVKTGIRTKIILLIILFPLNNLVNNIDKPHIYHDNQDKVILEKLINKQLTSNDLNITLVNLDNRSSITNGTEILFTLTGSLDKVVFYRWSTEINNDTFTVLETYFAIPAPNLIDVETWLELYLYSSVNSSEPNSLWINKRYSFYYDTKIPKYATSLENTSTVYSYINIQINTSEPVFNSNYRWDDSTEYYSLPNNGTKFNIYLNLGSGNHSLELTLIDSQGNTNISKILFIVLFTVVSDPTNNSRIKSGKILSFTFSDQYNVFYAWDDEVFSGVLDPAPANEGEHIIHLKVEKSPNSFETINFTFTIDNTSIIIGVNPSSGYVLPNTNITITVDEEPEEIWGEILGVGTLEINGTNPYWAILPNEYGKIDVKIFTIDEAENIGNLTTEYEISLSIVTMSPENDTIIDQEENIVYSLNAESWRTVWYNMNNTFNTSYLPNIPNVSGRHNLTIYLEDNEKRWTSHYFQWWVKPEITLENSFNGSRMRTNFELNFTFGEIISDVYYFWGNDTPLLQQNIESIITKIDEWTNKTEEYANLSLTVKGNDNVWNNQTYIFNRDDEVFSINLYQVENNSIIYYPYQVSCIFEETPYEMRYSWDTSENTTILAVNNPFSYPIPQNISTNPHILNVYFRDEAYNWNSSQYLFYVGTTSSDLYPYNSSNVKGGNIVSLELYVDPIRIGHQWRNHTDKTNITTLEWRNTKDYGYSKTYDYITIPFENNWSDLILFYDLGDGVILNETLTYLIDSEKPTVNILGTEGPFANILLMNNGTTKTISPNTIINITVSESVSTFFVTWRNETTLYDEPTEWNKTVIINISTLSRSNETDEIRVFVVDIVYNNATFIWYFNYDEVSPKLESVDPETNSYIRPNRTIYFVFNETVYYIELYWYFEDNSFKNETFYLDAGVFQLRSKIDDGSYSLTMMIYDFGGNQEEIIYSFVVDGTPPQVSTSYSNNSKQNSAEKITLTISEKVTNNSYYKWTSGIRQLIDRTSLDIPLILEEGPHYLTVYVEDLLGNNQTFSYLFIIDDTPITRPTPSLSSGLLFSSDIEILKFYFEEKPALVIANWNNGTNVTLSILNEPSMMIGLTTNGGNYYVWIEFPKSDFRTHLIRLFIKDDAGNWINYEYSYYKIPSLTDLIPLILLLVLVLALVGYWYRSRIKENVSRLIDKIKTVSDDAIHDNSSKDIKKEEEEKGDKIIFKKGETKGKSTSNLGSKKRTKMRKQKKREKK